MLVFVLSLIFAREGVEPFYPYIICYCFLILIVLLWKWSNTPWEKIVLYFSMVVGFLLITTSNDLFIVFLGVELQSFSFIILLANDKSKFNSVEGGLKYFIVGIISSIFFLLGYLLLWLESPYSPSLFTFNKENIGWILILLSVLTKLGCAPLHFWIIDVLESSNWSLFIIFSLLPKISLIILLSKILSWSIVFDTLAFSSLILGLMGALNQTKIKRLIAYSSVSNLGLILFLLKTWNLNENQPLYFYMVIYFVNLVTIILLLKFTQKSENPYLINVNKDLNKIFPILGLSLVFLSVGGVPPFSGFIPKWTLILNLIQEKHYFQSVIVVFLSILTIVYYLSIAYTMFLKKKPNFHTWEYILSCNKHISYGNLSVTAMLIFMSLTSIFIINTYNIAFILFS